MESPDWRVLPRLGFVCLLGVLLLLPTSCGTEFTGGRRSVLGLGGALRPSATAYELTLTGDAVAATSRPNGLASSVDLRRQGLVPPVQNQRWNSCIAWTLGYYVMTGVWARAVRDHGELNFIDLTKSENWFSPDYIYSQRDNAEDRQKAAPNQPVCFESDGQLGCMRPEQALWILVSKGCAKWNWMCGGGASQGYRSCDPQEKVAPQVGSRSPWQLADLGAERFRPKCFVRFGNLDELKDDTLGRMKAWLHEQGTPLAVVVNMMSGWVTYRGENRRKIVISDCGATEDRGVCLDATVEDLGGQHMMTVIGYDDSFPSPEQYPGLPPEKRGSFLIINQWGTKWGDKGYMWIPYSEFSKIWVGGYGIIGRDLEKPEEGAGECVQNPLTGAYTVIRERDDVPHNLSADETHIETTATPLVASGSPLPCGAEAPPAPGPGVPEPGPAVTCTGGTCVSANNVGSKNTAGQVDTADWYVFEVTHEDGALVTLSLGSNPDPKLRVIVMDEEFRRVGGTRSGSWQSRLCDPGCYYVRIYPSDRFDPDDQPAGIPYELTLTLALAGTITDDEICGAKEMTDGSATGNVRVNVSPTFDFDFVDWIDYWKYEVPASGELVAVLSGSDERFSDDVALVTFEGETAESALPVAWTSTKLSQGYDPGGGNAAAILRLGRAEAGETLWFALVHFGWTLDAFNKDLEYHFDLVRPSECPADCFETPHGKWPQPAAEREKKWQLLRSWDYEMRAGTSYYTFPINGMREVRVSVEPTPGQACPAGSELRLVTAIQALSGELNQISSKTVPADEGGELGLTIPALPRIVNAAGTPPSSDWTPYTAVHVEVHDPLYDAAYANARSQGLSHAGAVALAVAAACGQHNLRIEEWGIGSKPAKEYGPWGPSEPAGHRWFSRCFDPTYPAGHPIGEPSPHQESGLQKNEFGGFVEGEEIPCANIRNEEPIYLLRPTWDRSNEWILGSSFQWNQPWYTWQREYFGIAPADPIGRRLIVGVVDFCPEFDAEIAGQNGAEVEGLRVEHVADAGNAVFRRVGIPPTQPDGYAQIASASKGWAYGTGPGDIWLGLRDEDDRPLENYTVYFWNEATLHNWWQQVRDPDKFKQSEYGTPTAARILTLDGAGAGSASGFVGTSKNFEFYRVPVTQAGRVSVDLTNPQVRSGFGAVCVGVAVWDPGSSQWIPNKETRTRKEQHVEVPNAKPGTTLTILVENAVGTNVVDYTLQVTSGP